MGRKPNGQIENNETIIDQVKKTENSIADQITRQNIKHSREYENGETITERVLTAVVKIKEIAITKFPNGVIKRKLIRTIKHK